MAWSAPTEWERWDPEQLLVCPYNEAHKISVKRFQYHLVKCRKNHPEKDFVPCPFNAKHVVLRPALRHHVARCPDRSVIEQYSFKASTKDSDGFYFKGDTSLPGYSHQDWELQPSESWDDDGAQLSAGQFQPQRNSHQFSSAKQNSQSDTLRNMNSKERKAFKDQLKRQAVQSVHRTEIHNDQAFTPSTTAQSSLTRPSNNSIYMYGLQQTNQDKATVCTQGVTLTNRIPLAQAPRLASTGRAETGMLAAVSPGATPGQPTVHGHVAHPPESSPNTAEAHLPLPSQRLLEEARHSLKNSPGTFSSQAMAGTSSCESQRVPQWNFPSNSSVNKTAGSDVPAFFSQGMPGTSSSESQRVPQWNFQSSSSVNRTAGSDVSARVAYPLGQGVGRARLLAEARKNNFGGICRAHKTPGVPNHPCGRGRGVPN